jgi:translation initiation factor 2 beta subunit (eIF-2beta)/eIF-5
MIQRIVRTKCISSKKLEEELKNLVEEFTILSLTRTSDFREDKKREFYGMPSDEATYIIICQRR